MSWESTKSAVTRFLHYCAVTDPVVMANATEHDRRRHSLLGMLVICTAFAAGSGWTFKIYLATGNIGIALLAGIPIAMGMWCVERMLIASIPPDAGFFGRVFALAWRAILASL